MISLLLADPRIDPDMAEIIGATPFFIASQEGHQEVISLLLADPRIDPNRPKNNPNHSLLHVLSEWPQGGGFTAVG